MRRRDVVAQDLSYLICTSKLHVVCDLKGGRSTFTIVQEEFFLSKKINKKISKNEKYLNIDGLRLCIQCAAQKGRRPSRLRLAWVEKNQSYKYNG